MKKTIQLTAIENLISTYYITPYFNTLLNIPLYTTALSINLL